MRLRDFDEGDWSGFAGCEPISDQRDPMVGQIYVVGWPVPISYKKRSMSWPKTTCFSDHMLREALVIVDRDSIHLYDEHGSWFWLDLGWPENENLARSLGERIDADILIQWGFHYMQEGGWQII